MALWQWSTTPGSNANVGSINWAEGQAPSTVNNSARQLMADVADWVTNPSPEWYQHDSAAYASGTTFTVAGDQTGYYVAGRRLRAVNTSTTIYGSVVSATYGTNTTVTAVWDSGSLDSGLSSLKTGILSPTNQSVPNGLNLSVSALAVGSTMSLSGAVVANTSSFLINGTLSVSVSGTVGIYMNSSTTGNFIKYSCSGGAKFAGVNSSNQYQILSQNGGASLMVVDNSGNLTAAANITASSDERQKDEWKEMPDDFVERLSYVLSGTYSRTDVPGRFVGVGAQSLQRLMPEAVMEDEDGMLSVAYGNAALVACIELAKELRRLKSIMKKHGIKS